MSSTRDGPARAVFTVTRTVQGWAVEHGGALSNHTASQEEARASAHKLARASQDAGRPAQVNVAGEVGFFRVLR